MVAVTIQRLKKLINKRLLFPQNNVYLCPLCLLWVKRLKKHHIHKSPSIKVGICKDCERDIHLLEIESDIELDSTEDPHSANSIFKKLGFNKDHIIHTESTQARENNNESINKKED